MKQLPEIGIQNRELRTGTVGVLPDGHTLGIVNKDHEVEWLSDCILSITTETSGSGVTEFTFDGTGEKMAEKCILLWLLLKLQKIENSTPH